MCEHHAHSWGIGCLMRAQSAVCPAPTRMLLDLGRALQHHDQESSHYQRILKALRVWRCSHSRSNLTPCRVHLSNCRPLPGATHHCLLVAHCSLCYFKDTRTHLSSRNDLLASKLVSSFYTCIEPANGKSWVLTLQLLGFLKVTIFLG